ncbi:MAG: Ig-like domain-containing protein [Ilumatobacter sp.]
MKISGRNFRELGVIGVVVALVVGIVVVAVQADGRRTVRPQTNDGGAWLINAGAGAVGHLNRSVGEVTGLVKLAEPGHMIDTEQFDDIVVVVNDSLDTLEIVDTRNFQTVATVGVPDNIKVNVSGDEIIAWIESPLRVWKQSATLVSELDQLDDLAPIVADAGPGMVSVSRFGTVFAVATDAGRFWRLEPGSVSTAQVSPNQAGAAVVDAAAIEVVDLGAIGSDAVAVSASGDDAVVLTASGAVVVVEAGSSVASEPTSVNNAVVLGQPTMPGDPIVAMTDTGAIFIVDPTAASIATTVGQVTGADPLDPIFSDGCVFAVTTRPAEFTKSCDGTVVEQSTLAGSSGASLRLRLINGWVWINDLATGAAWVISADTPLDRIDDWGAALGNTAGDGEESDLVEDGQIQQRENPDGDDAEIIAADEIDEDGVNEPPVARDDDAATRTDVPVLVDVLRNDEDPDGDVLLITEVGNGPEGSLVEATGDRLGVQVTPRAGSTDPITFDYTISDGRGGLSTATVIVEVRAPSEPNRAPVAVTDAVTARAGSSASLNVLDNDRDPDGDPIVLMSVTAESGSVSFDGSGQITYTPDPAANDGTIQLPYSIRDTFGATANGTIKVAVRIADSNTEPDARNDSAVASQGKPVSFNVLLNDTDADGDAISVAGPPTVIAPTDTDALVDFSLSSDGQMFFESDQPGEYLLRYSISDGSESDSALIRVDVRSADENLSPVAVRDDLTITRGGSATAYVLLNDSDPDGDVVAIDNWESTSASLDVKAFRDIGFTVAVAPDAPDQLSFRYSITDGVNDPVTGIVVVAVTDTAAVNQPPVLARDVIEVRPGSTTTARVLINDFDPEGGILRVTDTSDVEGVTMRVGQLAQEIQVAVADTVTTGFTFSYEAIDDAGLTAAEFVDVRIIPDSDANRPPVARPDSTRTRAATSVAIAVLENDSDPDGDLIRVESIANQPTAGVATTNDDGTVTYTPDAGFAGTDRFSYVLVDEFGDRATGEVLVGVIPPSVENRPPTAVDDALVAAAGSPPLRIAVLDNDSDPDGDPISIVRTGGNAPVSVTDAADAIVYQPPATLDADTTATITYQISDGRGGESNAVVTIQLSATVVEAQAPIALDDTAGPVAAGTVVRVPVLANDADPDGLASDLRVQSDDPAGIVDPEQRTISYTAGDSNSAHRYTITDPDGLTSSGTVTILVVENAAPSAAPLAVDTLFDTPVTIELGGQVNDPDGDDLFFVCCDSTRNGSTTRNSNGPNAYSLTFTPDQGFEGQAGFAYTIDDQNGHQVSGSVTVTVAPKENGAPTATSTEVNVEAGTTATIALTSLTDDEDLLTGDVLNFSLGGSAANDVTLTDATISVVAAIDDAGVQRSIDYTVTDTEGATATATVSITVVESSAAPPIAVTDTAKTNQGVLVAVDVLANDVDELGQGLTLLSAGSAEAVGAIEFTETGTISYTPAGEFFGTAQINYAIEDARSTEAGRTTGTLQVEVVGRPGAPPTPQAVADNATATITWGQPASNGGPITAFELESDQGDLVELPATSSHTFNALTNGSEYTFRVRAQNEAGWSEWSAPSAPVTPDVEPGRPGAPTVAFADGALDVTWSEPASDGSPIIGYVLEIGGGQSATIELPASTTYTWPNLTNGTNYQFRVIAQNRAGPSDTSAWSNVEHPLREPDQPAAIDAQRGDGYLDLVWAAPADNGDAIIEYQVERESAPGAPNTTTNPGFRWSALPNGDFQRFRTRARNRDADWGQWSAWSNSEKPCGVPSRPAAPVAVRGDTQIALSWSAPSNDNGCAITGYTITSNTGLTRTATPSDVAQTIGGLSNGTSYSFTIIATNVEGNSAASAASNAVVPAGPPFAPTNMNAAPTATSGGSSYSFNAPGDNGAAITRYELQINGGGWETANVAGTAGTRNGLGENTGYYMAVRACNDVGCGSPSPAAGFTTFGPPTTPGGLSVAAGITLTWSWGSVPTNGSANRYEVRRFDSGGSSTIINQGANRSYQWLGAPWQPTGAEVRACNDLGCSAWSPRVNGEIRLNVGISHGYAGSCGTGNCLVGVTMASARPSSPYVIRCFNQFGQFGSQTLTTTSSGWINNQTLSNCRGQVGWNVYLTMTSTFGEVYQTSQVIPWGLTCLELEAAGIPQTHC